MSEQTPAPPTPPARPPVTHGLVDGTGELQTDDFGLDGDLTRTMTQALEQAWGEQDAAADAAQQDPADPAATPDPAPTSTPAEGVEAGAGVGGESAVEGAAPVDAATAPPAPAPDTAGQPGFDFNQYARDYFGVDLDRDQAAALFSRLNGLQALRPDQTEAIDRIIAGQQEQQQYQYPATTGQPVQQPAPPAQQLPPGLPPRPDDEYQAAFYDQMIVPLATTTQQQMAEMRENMQRTEQALLERQRQESVAAIESAQTAWRAKYPDLSDGEFDALAQRIIQSGTYTPLMNQLGPSQATTQILEQFYWADEKLRTRAIANVASGRQPGDAATPGDTEVAQQQAAVAQGRQARAGSVAGGGGAVTSRTPPVPTDTDGRKKAMTAELEAAMAGGE